MKAGYCGIAIAGSWASACLARMAKQPGPPCAPRQKPSEAKNWQPSFDYGRFSGIELYTSFCFVHEPAFAPWFGWRAVFFSLVSRAGRAAPPVKEIYRSSAV